MFFLRLFFGVFIGFFSLIVFADNMLMPYAGLDIQQRNMNFKKNYGDNIFSRKSLQNNVYFGFRLDKNFGLEGGYQSSQNTSKKTMTIVGEEVLGQVISGTVLGADGFIINEAAIRAKGPHLNMVGFLPIEDNKTDLIASLGITALTIKAEYKQLSNNVVGVFDPEDIIETTRYFSKTCVVPRAMFGIQRKFTESLGFRASFIYEFTSRFRQMASKNPLNESNRFLPGDGALKASLRNSITYGLGVFMNF